MARKNNKSDISETNCNGNVKPKKKHKILNFFLKPFGVVFTPVTQLVRMQINVLLKDIKRGIEQKAAGLLVLLFGVLLLHTIFLCVGVLIVVALYEFAHLSLFFSILIITAFYILSMIIAFLIGTSIMKKPFIDEDTEK